VPDFTLKRIGMVMEPRAGDPHEVEGVLNPAAARAPDGTLYLFPRLVAHGNYSRIGIARVLFDGDGNPCGVERMGIALEPEAEYELSETGGGCEDPRVVWLEPFRHYVMTYTALSSHGPRIAIATSQDLLTWRRMGLASFKPWHGLSFDGVDDKDASMFPTLVPNPSGHPAIGLVHRPLFPGTRPEEKVRQSRSGVADPDRECIWISYCDVCVEDGKHEAGVFGTHHKLAQPTMDWDRLKIGGGPPPIMCRHGWLLLFHGVHEMPQSTRARPILCYSAGAIVLSPEHPNSIIHHSSGPLLVPEGGLELHGTVNRVVFPTGIDRRDDLGTPDRFDVYYGMADYRIGVARLDVPPKLTPVSRDPKDAFPAL
jgi:beta-1,2-mannobiose phosphorylase / 1,2-beta-oligomannan phosphorylase